MVWNIIIILLMILNFLALIYCIKKIKENNQLITIDKMNSDSYFSKFMSDIQEPTTVVVQAVNALVNELYKMYEIYNETQKKFIELSGKVIELKSDISQIDTEQMVVSFSSSVEELESQITKMEKEVFQYKTEIVSHLKAHIDIQQENVAITLNLKEILQQINDYEQLLKNKEEHIQRINKTNRTLEKKLNKTNSTKE